MSPRPVGALCHRLSRVTRDDAENGFTLIEVIVAFVIFLIVATANGDSGKTYTYDSATGQTVETP